MKRGNLTANQRYRLKRMDLTIRRVATPETNLVVNEESLKAMIEMAAGMMMLNNSTRGYNG